MTTSVWLFEPRSHGKKKADTRAHNGAPLPAGRPPSFRLPHHRPAASPPPAGVMCLFEALLMCCCCDCMTAGRSATEVYWLLRAGAGSV